MSEGINESLNVQYDRIRSISSDSDWLQEGDELIMEETIYRARRLQERFLDLTPTFPIRASPGPGDGSIDLYSYAPNGTLLINIPGFADPDTSSISYHMIKDDDSSKQEGGYLEDDDIEKIRHIIEWMIE